MISRSRILFESAGCGCSSPTRTVSESLVKLNAIPACAAAVMLSRLVYGQEWKSGVEWEEPLVVIPGQHNSDAPSDAVVLFDGTNLSEWNNGDTWLIENGTAIPKETDIVSKRLFGDIQLHLEWATPDVIEGEGNFVLRLF